MSLKDKIKAEKKTIREAQVRLHRLMTGHAHVPERREICDGVVAAACALCGHDMGWWCPKSKNGLCVYGDRSEYCKLCGDPEERK